MMNLNEANLMVSPEEQVSQIFQMTVTGEIISESEPSIYLLSRDGTKLRVSPTPTITVPTGIMRWKVIPTTDSTGEIPGVHILDYEPASNEPDSCSFTGRVIQLGKRNAVVLFKVALPSGQKDLKITLKEPLPEMKASQLWKVNAIRQGNYLYIQNADSIEPLPPAPVNAILTPPPVNTILTPEPSTIKRIIQVSNEDGSRVYKHSQETKEATIERLIAIAKKALAENTRYTGWILSTPVQRRQLWEWEARTIIDEKLVLARVNVNQNTEIAEVYQFDTSANAKGCAAKSLSANLEGDNGDEINTTNKLDRLIVTPLGAARGIGASCFRIEIGPYEIVLDAGTRPKGNNPLPAFEYLENPNLILITHAHQDHIGALPVFHRQFPTAPMICTSGTREIAHVMLTDCLKVQQSNEDFEQLFDEYDLEQTLFRLETQPVGKDFEPLKGLKVRFIHAGHIVGAACVYLQYGNRSLLYTGDYNTTSSRTTDGLRLADLPQADILITESTYGADTHPSRKAQESELLKAVAEVIQAGGNVLIPAFALGRAQEILLAIKTSELFHKLRIPVYVDGLVRAVTDVFRDHLEFLPDSVQNFAKNQEPFFSPTGNPPIIPISHPRERPLALAKPSVIVASSGMLSGGASVYYGQALLERDNAAIFISGYTDEESPGRFLQSLQQGEIIKLEGKELTVRATIKRFNLSAHADKVGLTQVIHKVNPKHLILIHGSLDALHELARTGDLKDKYIVHIPTVGDIVEYGLLPEHIGAKQLAKLTLPTEFEVEVSAEVEGAWIHIPQSVVEEDPRWQMLAGNGLLRAKWEGISLKLNPISQRQIVIESALLGGEDCCATCKFFKNGYCQGESSPLFSLQVDPNGQCMEFQRTQELI